MAQRDFTTGRCAINEPFRATTACVVDGVLIDEGLVPLADMNPASITASTRHPVPVTRPGVQILGPAS